MKKLLALLALCGAVGFATPVWAEEVAAAEGVVAEAVVAEAAEAAPAPSLSKADNAWIIVASAFVILMSVPGLALFYGGMVRSKNMLSVLMQVLVVF